MTAGRCQWMPVWRYAGLAAGGLAALMYC